jgi:putative hemolysin
MTSSEGAQALSFNEELEERFARFVHHTRTDSYCLSTPGITRQILIYCLEMLLCGDRLTRKALAAHRGAPPPEGYLGPLSAGQVLAAHQIEYRIKAGSTAYIPKTGPVMFVGNHPHGMIDAMIGADVIMQVRKDLRVLANFSLLSNPVCGPYIAPIDFRGGRNADAFNIRSTAAFRQHVKGGGAGFVAPAGAIATREELNETATDGEWRTSAAKWARSAKATIVPMYIDGENSALFHLASKMNMVFRLGVLALENFRLRRSVRNIAIGAPISPDMLSAFPSALEATAFMRERTYALRDMIRSSETGEALEFGPVPIG